MTKAKRLSGQELLDAWRKKEETLRLEREIEKKRKLNEISHECKNCKRSWYKYVPPTGCFTEPSEFCGCRHKCDLVDPHGCCENFDID